MDFGLLAEQTLNGVQFGIMLFLMAAGLSVIFGIMNFINLTHGSLYMIGAFLMAAAYAWLGNFALALLVAIAGSFALGLVLDFSMMRRLYDRTHLDQVLATFGMLMFFNELTLVIWGPEPQFIPVPKALEGVINLPGDVDYPVYRLAITAAGLAIALALYLMVEKTRLGMLIRAGATDREMLSGLGVDVRWLFTAVFTLGVVMAAFAGMMTGPLVAVQVGMGESMLIVAFVVVVIGGIGSIFGALVSSLLVGLVDTMGRSLLPIWLGYSAGPALASMTIYVLMAGVLLWRPQGLFARRRL
jgi:branched-chain amino acid transport system permease protein